MTVITMVIMMISISIVVAADVSGDDDGDRRDDDGAFCHMVVEVVDLIVIIFVVSTVYGWNDNDDACMCLFWQSCGWCKVGLLKHYGRDGPQIQKHRPQIPLF